VLQLQAAARGPPCTGGRRFLEELRAGSSSLAALAATSLGQGVPFPEYTEVDDAGATLADILGVTGTEDGTGVVLLGSEIHSRAVWLVYHIPFGSQELFLLTNYLVTLILKLAHFCTRFDSNKPFLKELFLSKYRSSIIIRK